MNLFPATNMDVLKNDLIRLGFPNARKIIRGRTLERKIAGLEGTFIDMLYIDKQDRGIEYRLIAKTGEGRREWYLYHISAYLSMDNPETREPGPRVFRAYSAIDGFLPDKERIRMDLSEALRGDTTKRIFARYPHLEEEFMKHGFDKNAQRITYDSDIGIIVFFTAEEKMLTPQGNGTEKVNFSIGVLIDAKRSKSQVLEIQAMLTKEIEVDRKLRREPVKSISLHIDDGALPNRQQIMDLFRSASFEIKPLQWGKSPYLIMSPKEMVESERLKEVRERFELPLRVGFPLGPGGYRHRM